MKPLLLCFLSAIFFSTDGYGAARPGSLFSGDAVVPVELRIERAEIRALAQNPREYVRAKIARGTNIFCDTEVRLKGNATFRPINQKASFSLKLSAAAQREFGGHRRLLLNNSVQDESYMRSKIASEMLLKAGLPTARINFAAVTLNGRPLGLYLLVEGTDDSFLAGHFGSPDGNLYEGADQDINTPLEIDSSPLGTDRSDLQALLQACLVEDLPTRWSKLGQILDIERFATFMAMELLVGHKDGYCMDLNNYRLYNDKTTRKFVFIAHGMDFVLDNPVLEQDRAWKGVVAKAFIKSPQGLELYRERINELGLIFYGDRQQLARRVDELWKVLRPALSDASQKERVLVSVRDLQSILRARATSFPDYVLSLQGR